MSDGKEEEKLRLVCNLRSNTASGEIVELVTGTGDADARVWV